MRNGKRAIVIVLDSVGVGMMPDASDYGDSGANTLKTLLDTKKGLNIPTLEKMGLLNISGFEKYVEEPDPIAMFGKMAELSKGKDTMTGHWEMMGLITEKPFPRFPGGFPEELTGRFLWETGLNGFLGNCVASGTEIINSLGTEHLKTGYPIIYTSADSVFQIAAHEEVIPPDELYKICEISRNICNDYNIGRVIARPFTGSDGNFTRTPNRRDYPMIPPFETVLDYLKSSGFNVVGIGKIEDIFAGRGLTGAYHTKNNEDGMNILSDVMKEMEEGLIFVNLVDFDMLYGHRRDPMGYAKALEDFDIRLGELINVMEKDDLLVITADHGCDPAFGGTDHTREYVPLLVYGNGINPCDLGTRRTFSDIGVSLLDYFGLSNRDFPGKSFI